MRHGVECRLTSCLVSGWFWGFNAGHVRGLNVQDSVWPSSGIYLCPNFSFGHHVWGRFF